MLKLKVGEWNFLLKLFFLIIDLVKVCEKQAGLKLFTSTNEVSYKLACGL